jgi:hypothetical protein
VRSCLAQLGFLVVLFLIIFSALAGGCAGIEPKAPIKVLLLYSWFKDMPWQKAIETGIKRNIAQREIPLKLFVEYVDGSRFPLSKTQDALYSLFRAKYVDSSNYKNCIRSDFFPLGLPYGQRGLGLLHAFRGKGGREDWQGYCRFL